MALPARIPIATVGFYGEALLLEKHPVALAQQMRTWDQQYALPCRCGLCLEPHLALRQKHQPVVRIVQLPEGLAPLARWQVLGQYVYPLQGCYILGVSLDLERRCFHSMPRT